MARRLTVSFDRADYTGYPGGAVSVSLSERQRGLIATALSLMLIRSLWDDMPDSDWDNLEAELSALMEAIYA